MVTVAGLPKAQQVRYGLAITPKRIALARRHQARTSALLREIERILADLLHVRDLWRRRHRSVIRERDLDVLRGDGRRRDR